MITTERLVEIVKDCGQTIIDNAESIVGDYKYQTRITVSFEVGMDNVYPEIKATSEWVPEAEIEKARNIIRIDKK